MSNITIRSTSHLVQRAAKIFAIAVAVVTICNTASAFAQAAPNARDHFNSSAVDRILKPQSSTPTPLRSQYDRQVVQTRFDQTPAEASARNQRWSSDDLRDFGDPLLEVQDRRQNFIQREKEALLSSTDASTPKPAGQKMGQVIANIGMNLAFVLLVGIGFIVLSKQWLIPKAKSKKESTETVSSKLRVKEELVLDSKTTIRVIQWNDAEILVASDGETVRSMISLGPTFSDTLSQVETEFETQVPERRQPEPERYQPEPERRQPEPEPERHQPEPAAPQMAAQPKPAFESNRGIDDRLIQMLLDSANRSASAASSLKGKV